ncbi:hypothetical protein DSL72_002129 [Monilinia vaccinii-corymbosi]|uniref:Nucleoporin Nup133/Nup155-like C-terminal domain-containing protein n=1 Tax=Monilinia vaccinii-corymbosi TaxID=61207 RepID=A0A8A3PBS7_9HELO|nr:hypothetical protein DSL72_002129 [Monilinia vaccinii-corymbosi]
MFSPTVSAGAPAPVRSSRRRPRPHSHENSLAQPKSKRVRSSYDDQTFAPNGTPEMDEANGNPVATLTRRESPMEIPNPRQEMAVRGKKSKGGERAGKGDGSVVLTQNDTYTVSKLPALPDQIRTDVTARQHGAIFSDSGYALALTHSHAFVWPYAVNIPSPETFTFTLPHSTKHGSDPLPLGSLVSPSASSPEPGLVIVIPTTGKITYWESIASAATLDLIKLKSNGVGSTIPGMLSGETVAQILNAETAGFVLAFSTGRLAYLRVRDGHGRPEISVQFLRGSSGALAGGIFRSLRNVLSSSAWRGDIAAVRAGPQEHVGDRNVVVATGKGRIQLWNLQRDGQNALRAEAEGREAIVMEIKKAEPTLFECSLETFQVIDFTFTPRSVESQGNQGDHLLLLTSLSNRHTTHYTLVDAVLKREQLIVEDVRLVRSYTTPINQHAISKARIYLPSPALVAYIIFDSAVVVVSRAKWAESPDSQLRSEDHTLTPAFEDVVDFREDTNVEIVGSGMEEPQNIPHGIEEAKSRKYKAKHPAAVLLVRGGGVIRVAATNIDKLISSTGQQVTAKSKLEQAVFFGTMSQNPLSFAGRSELQFPAEEVGEAALQLSLEIVKSKTPFIPSVSASLEQHLKRRAAALHDLAKHLKSTGVALDRVTRWKLLWDAEKMMAATIIWQRYDNRIRELPEGQKHGLLAELVDHIHEDFKTEPIPEKGEVDRVRHFFIHDVARLQLAIPWSFQIIKYAWQDGQNPTGEVTEIVSQSDDMMIGALEGAFDFRMENLRLYGLQSEILSHGVLEEGYEGLPEFWTSTFYIAENVRKQTDLVGLLLEEYWNKPSTEASPDPTILDKIRLEHPALIDMAIRSNMERIRWVSAQDSPQLQLQAEAIQLLQVTAQNKQLRRLALDWGLPDESMKIAEKHEILQTLAAVLMFEATACVERLGMPGIDPDDFEYFSERAKALNDRVDKYFANFGASWATALYEYYISQGGLEPMLNEYQNHRSFLTAFLRDKPEYAKIGWIHEVTREKDYDEAARMLLELGLDRERDVWSKKVELSIGKLSRMAGRNYSQKNGIFIPDGGEAELVRANQELGLLKIQDLIYQYIYPSIDTAIDDNAEVQLALETHGNKDLKRQFSFMNLLENSMTHLVKHEAMDAFCLVDLLTLMGDNFREMEQDDFIIGRFYWALEAIRLGVSNKEEKLLIQRLIWRRCLLGDDWVAINNTEAKDDQFIEDRLKTTALYWTLKACFKNRIFEKDLTIQPLSPQEVIGACTVELEQRWSRIDASMRERMMQDYQIEDDALTPYLETARLEKWHQQVLDLAKQDFRNEIEEETNEGSIMNQEAAKTLEDLERSIAENEKGRAEDMLMSKPRYRSKPTFDGRGSASGSVGAGSFRSSVKLY